MKPNEEILGLLKSLLSTQAGLRFFDVYKGVPVAYEGNLLNVLPAQAVFQVHKYQATCIEVNQRAYFRSGVFPSIVRGSVVKVDFLKDVVILANFTYCNTSMGNRSIIRVVPKEVIPIEFSIKGRTLLGEVADLSAGGMGIRTGAIYYEPQFFTMNSRVELKFELPISGVPLSIIGNLVNVKRERSAYRLGIRTNPDTKAKEYIHQYIAQRQVEIQRELQLMHDLFYQLQIQEK